MIVKHREPYFPPNIWRKWFALLPVNTRDGYFVWLNFVWRKHPRFVGKFIDYTAWEYCLEPQQDKKEE